MGDTIPEKKNKRKHDWKRQYVVSNRKIFFYNTAEDKATSKPSMILDIRYVRSDVRTKKWSTGAHYYVEMKHKVDSSPMKKRLVKEIYIFLQKSLVLFKKLR